MVAQEEIGSMERLREICGSDTDSILMENQEYIRQSKKCVGKFNRLKKSLSKEQRSLLYEYEEEIAFKESLIIDILAKAPN